jgi:hypothetical protein
VGTKLDLPEAAERYEEFVAMFPSEKVFGISVFSGVGLDALKEALHRQVVDFEAAAGGEKDIEEADGFFDMSEFDSAESDIAGNDSAATDSAVTDSAEGPGEEPSP